MSEMIVRVEAAILKGMRERWNPPAIARMAIEAMREPTKAMIQAGGNAVEDGVDSTTDSNGSYDVIDNTLVMNAVWRAAIDEALKP